jgi:hypothetical protein
MVVMMGPGASKGVIMAFSRCRKIHNTIVLVRKDEDGKRR